MARMMALAASTTARKRPGQGSPPRRGRRQAPAASGRGAPSGCRMPIPLDIKLPPRAGRRRCTVSLLLREDIDGFTLGRDHLGMLQPPIEREFAEFDALRFVIRDHLVHARIRESMQIVIAGLPEDALTFGG